MDYFNKLIRGEFNKKIYYNLKQQAKEDINVLEERMKKLQEPININKSITHFPSRKISKLTKEDYQEQTKHLEDITEQILIEKRYDDFSKFTSRNLPLPLTDEELQDRVIKHQEIDLTLNQDLNKNRKTYFSNNKLIKFNGDKFNENLKIKSIFYEMVSGDKTEPLIKVSQELSEIKAEIERFMDLEEKEYQMSDLIFNPHFLENKYLIKINDETKDFTIRIKAINFEKEYLSNFFNANNFRGEKKMSELDYHTIYFF